MRRIGAAKAVRSAKVARRYQRHADGIWWHITEGAKRANGLMRRLGHLRAKKVIVRAAALEKKYRRQARDRGYHILGTAYHNLLRDYKEA